MYFLDRLMWFFVYSSQDKSRELCMPYMMFYLLSYICVFSLAGIGKLLSGIATFLLYHTHFKRQKSIFFILMYVPCILYSLLFRPTNELYILTLHYIYRKYSYMFQCICIIFRESYPFTLLKLQKSSWFL